MITLIKKSSGKSSSDFPDDFLIRTLFLHYRTQFSLTPTKLEFLKDQMALNIFVLSELPSVSCNGAAQFWSASIYWVDE